MTQRLAALLAFGFLVTAQLGACAPFIGCIREGELIETPEGERPVESLRVGDEIVTAGGTGKLEQVRQRMASEFLEVLLSDGHLLRATGQHPVATIDGFVRADALRVGQNVIVSGGMAAVVSLTEQSRATRVFDLTVWPGETFFASGVLVHNKSVPLPPRPEDFVGEWTCVAGRRLWHLSLRAGGGGELVSAVALGDEKPVVDQGAVADIHYIRLDDWRAARAVVDVRHVDAGAHEWLQTLVLKGTRGMTWMEADLEWGGSRTSMEFVRDAAFQTLLDATGTNQ